MKRLFALMPLILFLPGAVPPVQSITYETGPCFGSCPVYRVTVSSDGTGLYQGNRHVAVRGQRRFRVSAAQFRAFARFLQPIRPARGSIRYMGDERCRPEATDMPSAEVTWRDGRRRQSLYYYFGCNPRRYREMAQRLQRAPALLPIGAWIAPPARQEPHG